MGEGGGRGQIDIIETASDSPLLKERGWG